MILQKKFYWFCKVKYNNVNHLIKITFNYKITVTITFNWLEKRLTNEICFFIATFF